MRVLISGARIAGPTLAYFLAKAGARITVVEKSHSFRATGGQNIDITVSAITVIKKMGLLDRVRECHTTEKGTKFIDPKGRPFAPFPLRENGFLSPTNPFEILRGDLAAVLYSASTDQSNVNYMFGTTVEDFISNDEDIVKVKLSNGTVQEFDLLVAADGQWSKVRRQCFPPESVNVVDTGMYAVYWTVPRVSSDDDWWNVYQALDSRIITLRPDRYGTTRAMFTCMPSNDVQNQAWLQAARGDRTEQKELLRREFTDAGWQARRFLDSLDQADELYFQAVQQIRMPEWSNSRVVCLGDTAYAPTPLTGMGTPLAIIGAYVLAGELNKLPAGQHPSKALEAYDSTFRPFVEKIQNIPSTIPGIAQPQTAWKRWLFGAFVSTLSRLAAMPWFERRFATGDFEAQDEGFPLPPYPTLDEKGSR